MTETAAINDNAVRPLVFARRLTGARVYNKADELLGTIDDIALRSEGTVAYAVLSHGGMAGLALGDKRFAVPFTSLSIAVAESGALRVTLDATPASFERAPGFDAEHPPLAADYTLAAETASHLATLGK